MKPHINDMIHATVVVIVVVASVVYALAGHDHSGNVWIVLGSAIGYAAGRSGPSFTRTFRASDTD